MDLVGIKELRVARTLSSSVRDILFCLHFNRATGHKRDELAMRNAVNAQKFLEIVL